MEKVHILHVEDNPIDATMLETSLSGTEVTSEQLHQVRTGEEALLFLERNPPHETAPEIGLILLDLTLPTMSGFELLGRLKEHPATRNIPVVVLTGSVNQADYRESYLRHANAVVRKPESLSALIELVNALDSFWMNLVALDNTKKRGVHG